METMNNKHAALLRLSAAPVTFLPSTQPSLASWSCPDLSVHTLMLEQNARVLGLSLSNLFGPSSLMYDVNSCRHERTVEPVAYRALQLSNQVPPFQPLLNPIANANILKSCNEWIGTRYLGSGTPSRRPGRQSLRRKLGLVKFLRSPRCWVVQHTDVFQLMCFQFCGLFCYDMMHMCKHTHTPVSFCKIVNER